MDHKIFTVYDSKAEAFLPPFLLPAIGMATRSFSECINSKDHHFAKHPADYTLFHIAEFDDLTASIATITPKSLGNGVEFLDNSPPQSPKGYHEIDTDSPIQPN